MGDDWRKGPLKTGLILAILCLIPIWVIEWAPLTDWPIHLADSKLAYGIISNQLQSPFYHVQFDVLSYSLVHLLLVGLQYLVSLSLAGKLVLSLLTILSPACWWYFLHTLQPKKERFFVLGFLTNFTIFFYAGNIDYLFAVDFGLVFIAIGLQLLLSKKGSWPLFLLSGALTYVSHGYVFLLLCGALGAAWFYQCVYRGKPAGRLAFAGLAGLLLLGAFGILGPDLFPSSGASKDQSYSLNVSSCLDALHMQAYAHYQSAQIHARLASGVLVDVLFNKAWVPDIFLRSVFPYPNLRIMALLVIVSLALYLFGRWLFEREPLSKTIPRHLPPVKVGARFYLGLSMLFFLHYLLVPSVVPPNFPANLDYRSLIFAFAFLLLAIDLPWPHRLEQLVILLVLVNVIFQSSLFYSHSSQQQAVLSKLQVIASRIPANQSVFVVPAIWDAYNGSVHYPLYGNPHYHAFLSIDKPSLYVSGLFLDQNSYILRSRFPLYDEITFMLPVDSLNQTARNCYPPAPSIYDWVVDENMTLHPNSKVV